MQGITKKNLNTERFGIAELRNCKASENGGNGDKKMSLPLFLYLHGIMNYSLKQNYIQEKEQKRR